MAKSSGKKSAKGRLDKYYKLAKEQGFRARSAFKLIQLNRKYEFLNNARFCIDLCAAPGGWLQVASKYMPVNSLILGCDLDGIKPIPRVTTFVADITTDKCRSIIRSHAKDWKADVILHDGAPNVGTAWVQDAYSQSELVLSSLKLAVDFLRKGGTFITKVFRSKDYNNLMWVFNQLFGKVEATKPPSSRNVSAEIFVVCLNYRAPANIDPKFLDPRHVFKDVEALPPAPVIEDATSVKSLATKTILLNAKLAPNALAVFKPHKKVRHRDGYADDVGVSLFKAGAVSQFVLSNGPAAIAFLSEVNRIDFISDEEKRWYNLEITDSDIKANCADLKVLGKRDFQRLLKWRSAIREDLGIETKKKPGEEFTESAEVIPLDPAQEDEQMEQELERLTVEEATRRKRERRKVNERRQKRLVQMQLRMVAPTEIGLEATDPSLSGNAQVDFFDIHQAEKKKAVSAGEDRLMAAYDVTEDSSDDEAPSADEDDTYMSSDEEEEARIRGLESGIDTMYADYMQRKQEKDAKFRVREENEKTRMRTENWDGIQAPKVDSDDDSDDDDEVPSHKRGWDNRYAAKDDGDVSDTDVDDDDDEEDSRSTTRAGEDTDSQRPTKRRRLSPSEVDEKPKPTKLVKSFDHLAPKPSSSKAAQIWFSQDVFKGLGDIDDIESDSEAEDEDDSLKRGKPSKVAFKEEESEDGDGNGEDGDTNDYEIVPQDDDTTMWDVEDENIDDKKQELIKKHGLLTAEAVTIAQKLVNRQTTKTELINAGFTRHSMHDKDGLPSWFLDEESQHYQPNIPVTKEAVRMLRDKQRALDARPIKKIAEAKARKKMRALKRLQKASKMAEGLTENGDMSEKQKAEAMQKIMRKGSTKAKQKKPPTQVIVANGKYRGEQGRPKGVKGKFKIVDHRMKKDLRSEKRAAKKKGKSSR